MANAKQGVHVVKLKPVVVPSSLLEGEKFIKWDEDSSVGTPVTLKVDEQGFYIHWTDQRTEIEFLDISLIRDTRTGKYAKNPKDPKIKECINFGSSDSLEDKTLTICYGTDFVNVQFLNFTCGKREVARVWSDELLKLAYNLLAQNGSVETFLKKTHSRVLLTVDRTGRLPFTSVLKLFASHKEDKRRVERAFELADIGVKVTGNAKSIDPKDLTFDRFYEFYKYLTHRQDVEKVFVQLCGDKKKYMTTEELVEFLNHIQRDPRLNEILYPYANQLKARDIINQYEPSTTHGPRGLMSLEGFMRYLISEDNLVVKLDKLDLSDDMDQPLAHYFINSSHNTYLTGHQIKSKSSAEMYRQALLSGCRCIELDFWNNSFTNEPVIVHGYTLVQEIPAKDAIDAIAESAFKTSDYPVILSFENHCNRRNQAKIAQYCREAFGELLLEAPIDGYPLESGVSLPPPSLLKRRIIIKNKKKIDYKNIDEIGVEDEEEIPSDSEVEELSSEQLQFRERTMKDKGTAGKETEAGAEISALVNYVTPVHFHSFESAELRKCNYEMSSFVETQAMALLKEHPVEFVNYNKRQMSRVYPRGTRVESSNFMPHIFWNIGVQMVALNFQTVDVPMQLNLALFEYNNRTGFLLKPDFMRRDDKRFDPFSQSTVDGIVAAYVSIQVISGQMLSERRVGTYVEVEMYGIPVDTVRKKYKTKMVPLNGINPQYEDEPFVFPKIVFPDLACIRLAVYDDSGRMIGHRVLPVTGLCPGYRHISLRNELGQPLYLPSIFVYIVVKDYVPDSYSDIVLALSNPIKWQNKLDEREKALKKLYEDTEDSKLESEAGDAVPPTLAGDTNALGLPLSLPTPSDSSVASQPDALATHQPVKSSNSNPIQQSVSKDKPFEPPLLIPETVTHILESKSVSERREEYKKEIRKIRGKLDRTMSSSSSDVKENGESSFKRRLVKRISSTNLKEHELKRSSSDKVISVKTNCRKKEIAAAVKAFEALWKCASKELKSSQIQQVETLSDWQKRTTEEIMKNIKAQSKENMKQLKQLQGKDSNDKDRIKSEVSEGLVTKGVEERKKLLECFMMVKAGLEEKHIETKEKLVRCREKCRAELEACSDLEKEPPLDLLELYDSLRYSSL